MKIRITYDYVSESLTPYHVQAVVDGAMLFHTSSNSFEHAEDVLVRKIKDRLKVQIPKPKDIEL